jgi:spermidine/putrescine transport system ATP-binding protein
MTAPLSIRNVSRSFGDFRALDTVSLDIAAGEFIVLLGPSGCGKTTLLSILGGFIDPSSGIIEIGGRDMTHVPPAKRPTTTMFQDYALFPHMRLIDNVGFGLRMAGVSKSERDRRALELLAMVGLEASANRKPHELSGGQRQRVALARALAVEPDVLLLDEPLGALDLKLRRQMQDELKAIQKRVGTTFIHVTHDQEEAMAIADRIVVMNGGRIVDIGSPSDIYMRPRSRLSASFMGEANFIDGRLEEAQDGRLRIATGLGTVEIPERAMPHGAPALGGNVTLVIRPEQFRTGADTANIARLGRARIERLGFFGTHYRCHLQPDGADARELVAHLPQSSPLKEGDTIDMIVDAAAVVALPNPTGTAP